MLIYKLDSFTVFKSDGDNLKYKWSLLPRPKTPVQMKEIVFNLPSSSTLEDFIEEFKKHGFYFDVDSANVAISECMKKLTEGFC